MPSPSNRKPSRRRAGAVVLPMPLVYYRVCRAPKNGISRGSRKVVIRETESSAISTT